MSQNSTAKISLTPAQAKALHRQMSAAIEHIAADPARFIKNDKDILNDVKTTKKVLGKISMALEKRRKAGDAK
jgi:hypothetical protein